MLRRKNDQLNKGELARVATTTMWWAHNGGTHWNLRTQHVHICQVWNHGPPSARTPIDVEWRKRCAQNDEQPIQGSLTRGNQSVQQIFKAPLVQSACAIILGVHAIVQSLMLDIKGEWWKQRRGYLGVPTILGIETPICFVKQLVVAHVPSPRLHGSCCQSLEFVAPDVVLHLCLVMHMGHPHGVVATMQHILRAGSSTDVRAENSWQSNYRPRNLCVWTTLSWPHVHRLGWWGMFWKTTLVCRLGKTSMMRTLGFYFVIKPFLLVTVNHCAT